ncbi:uncharacterized protein MONOS_18195 [Monocercomonoides exilis]|uniref:uncharacterized protein n=1 Tax=Monocercomonoides exilis TaxID=2049356 RepID=UPI00355A50B3|nr:hypothetical protein MONOS_18195 [Monocercomonoides exilis]
MFQNGPNCKSNQPICFVTGKKSSVLIDDCKIFDQRFSGRGMVYGENAHSYSVHNSIICNITREDKPLQMENSRTIVRWIEESNIENCKLMSTENAFFGTMIPGLKGVVHFNCQNTSVLGNKDRNDGYNRQNRIDTPDSISLNNSEWIDCNSTTHGGAISITGNSASTLSLSNCLFQGNIARNGRGGAIFTESISRISIRNSIFLNCQAPNESFNEAGGAICIATPQSTYIVGNNSFRNCHVGNDGGGISIGYKSVLTSGDVIADCSFINCSTSNVSSPTGGGIQMWGMMISPVVTNCLFLNNYAVDGGGITIHLKVQATSNIILFCFFHNNSAVGACDVLLHAQNRNSIDLSSFTTSHNAIRVSNVCGDSLNRNEWLRNEGGRIRFISSTQTQPNARDAFSCGINESYPCNTISHCLKQLIPDYVENIEILGGTIVESKWIECGENRVTICGQSEMNIVVRAQLKASLMSLFSVSTGALTIRDFSLEHHSSNKNNCHSRIFEITGEGEMHINRLNISAGSGQSSETAFSTELINVQNGMFQMDSVNWAKTISTTSLFSLSSTNEVTLTLSECTFNGIERTTSGAAVMQFSNGKANIDMNSCTFERCGSRTSDDGGSMMLCVGNANEVKVKSGSFDGCYCSASNGFGGGILLRLLNENPNFLISSSFGTNTAKWGNDIFAISPNLEVTAKSQKIQCVTASLDSFDKVRGYENGNTSVAIPLCIYLLPNPTEIYHSLARLTGEKKVSVNGMISMGDELAFSDQKHEIRGNDDQSELTFLFLSVESGILAIDSFSASSITLSNNPLISLSGSSAKAELINVQMNGVGTSYASGLIEVKSKASLQMSDSDVSSIASSEGIASSCLISTSNAKIIEIIRTDISNFAVKGKNGGAIECTLESGCSLVFEEGNIHSCKSEGGNGGGLCVQMKSGSHFSICNATESLSINENENEHAKKICISNCEASSNVDGSRGLGGGIYLNLDEGASDFVLKSMRFDGCSGRKGKDVFLNAFDLRDVTNSATFCFDVDVNGLDKLNGFERSTTNEIYEIPLVVYLWNNFTSPCHVGGEDAHDFSGCGHAQVPCSTITNAVGFRFSGKNKSIKLHPPFSFGEELKMDSNEWSMTGEGSSSNYEIGTDISGSQSGIFETHCRTTFGKVVFSVAERIGFYESIFHCIFNKLTIQDCGISATESQLDISFVKIEGGKVTISNVFEIGIKWQTSAIICDGGSGAVPLIEIIESNFSGNGEQNGCLIECKSVKYLNATKCDITEMDRTAGCGGCISVDNSNIDNENAQIFIKECAFDGCSVLSDGGIGGAIFTQMKGNAQVDIISCTFTGCTAPDEEVKTGFGGGMALKLMDSDPSFVISLPVFDVDNPNTAKYGNDLFVESSNLTKSITNTSLPFVSEHLSDISLDSLRGFDGNDTTNAIPLVYFWRTFGPDIFIGSEGRDVCICGLSDYPCLSIDYSLGRILEGNERSINIIGKGILQKSVEISGISVKSDKSSMCSLECVSSLEGAEGTAMKIQGITNFELIKLMIPSSFTSEVNVLLQVGSSEGLLTLKDCSFNKNEESREEEIINFVLIKTDGGMIQLEFVSMQSLSFSKDIISAHPTTILNMKNLTMKSIQLEGASGLSISKSSKRVKNKAEQDIVIEWSVFEEVIQNTTDDNPIIRNENDEEQLKLVVRNTTMKRCGGSKCEKGGGMFCVLNEGGSFDCLFCTISECFCSTTGRGGWLFLEFTSTVEQPLNFVLSNITFRDNSALRGRDAYVRCHSIETQIVDEQFLLDFRLPFVKELAVWGCITDSFLDEEDLLLRVVKYQSETIFVSAIADNRADNKQCGEFNVPCESLNVGVKHIVPSRYSQLLIMEQTAIAGACNIQDVSIRSLQSPSSAFVCLNSTIANDEESIFTTSERVRIENVKFNFYWSFSYSGSSVIHEANGQLSLLFVDFSSVEQSDGTRPAFLNSTLLNIENGILHVDNCTISMLSSKKPSFLFCGEEISLTNVKLEHIEATTNVFEIGNCERIALNGLTVNELELFEGCIVSISDSTSGTVSITISSFNNCSRNSEGASILSASSSSAQIVLSNCSCSDCFSKSEEGSMMKIGNAIDASMRMCEFEGLLTKDRKSEGINSFEETCKWNGSLVHSSNSTITMKDVSISTSSLGGLSISAGNMTIEKGEFFDNNPFIRKYPSLRRNIICCDSASLTISSLKGGDGQEKNTSLWMLNDGCSLSGVARERSSPFFIPVLNRVSVVENGSNAIIKFEGTLFLPCNLSFKLTFIAGDVEFVEKYDFGERSFVSEEEVGGVIPGENLTSISAETEASICILFGNIDSPSSTDSFILKNKSKFEPEQDERVAEGEKGANPSWAIIIAVVFVILFLIVLIASILLVVRWRKQKKRTEELEVIVEDTVRKDPKLIEMTTMEMSPEEQWRRAEREAEKKNEERIKKRVYGKQMQHSESSEHLLSESGSTEYILGRDSDKIPEWVLEKVDEKEIEEETRKRTSSPSISSTSTTDTSDTDTTFVRSESLCPTTSSMSNLVDAMACSSPHEKLIVDLRDSLFMLIHGRNEKKEMAICTLQEREMTAAQILFWVANGALHSFKECEVPLQSLSNLSPHIVLFSEHMVICIVMHSDLLSDDSDSSSISSSTVVTSASDDDDDRDSLPSSAFEDEDDFKKECLRWKAPELMNGTKNHATKKTVVFSIGMMLWECLTLQIPFGEYPAEVAGQKIVNGERPDCGSISGSGLCSIVKAMLSREGAHRPSLEMLKREYVKWFPGSASVLTVSDAIGAYDYSDEAKSEVETKEFLKE